MFKSSLHQAVQNILYQWSYGRKMLPACNTWVDFKLKPIICAVTLCILSSGCAIAFRPYVHPEGQPYAYIQSGSDLKSGHLNNISIYDKAETCERRYIVAMQDRSFKFYRIPAERDLSVTIHYYGGEGIGYGATCIATMRFTPVHRQFYWALYSHKDGKCYARLLKSDTFDFKRYEDVNVEQMKFSNGLDENSSFCSPIKK